MQNSKFFFNFFFVIVLSQIIGFQIAHAQNQVIKPKHHHVKKKLNTAQTRQKKSTRRAVVAASAYNNNQEQQRIDNALALWQEYCNNNPSDSRCNNQDSSTIAV